MECNSSASQSMSIQEHIVYDKGFCSSLPDDAPTSLDLYCDAIMAKKQRSREFFQNYCRRRKYEHTQENERPFNKNNYSSKKDTGEEKLKLHEGLPWVGTLLENSDLLIKQLPREKEEYLEPHFLPGEWDVICGRGKHGYDHVGNRRFRILIAIGLNKYMQAKNRREMSLVIDSVLHKIREASPRGGFVQKDDKNDRWYEIGKKMARKKVSHSFRDCMTGKLRRKNQLCSIKDKKKALRESQDNIFRSCKITFSSSSLRFDAELHRIRKMWKAKRESGRI